MDNDDKSFRVLFVCSGNTCRSPMAEVVLRAQAAERGFELEVGSAGAFAADRAPMTVEAQRALERAGFEPGAHSSRRLTAAMIEAADVVLAMEPVHRDAVLAIDAAARDRVWTLNEFGLDEPDPSETVWDPFGGSDEIYEACLERIRRHTERVERTIEEQSHGVGRRRP